MINLINHIVVAAQYKTTYPEFTRKPGKNLVTLPLCPPLLSFEVHKIYLRGHNHSFRMPHYYNGLHE